MHFEGIQSVRTVLHNPELLERILEYLNGCKPILVSASLTARAFSEPAFNVLWYEIYSLGPLFQILPTFERRPENKCVFTGPIRNEHLQRVLYYAKRIRVLHYREVSDAEPPISGPGDLAISTFMRMDRLGAFLALRRIYLHISFKTVLLPLTCPNLDRIEIEISRSLPDLTEIELASFLQSVASQSPPLQCLVIEGPMKADTLQVLPDFTKLEYLAVLLKNPDIPEQFLQQLGSSMPSLRSLHIKTISPRSPNEIPQRVGRAHSTSRIFFPSLQTLDVQCNVADLESIFGVLETPLLKSVSLTLPQSYPNASADMHKFIERNGQVLKNTVHKVVIRAFVDPSLGFVKAFEQLRELTVTALSNAISMSHIADAYDGSSWSRSLTCLQLRQDDPTNPLDCLSIAALCLIADTCPNLKSLEISIYRPDEPDKQIAVKKDGLEREPHYLEKLVFLNLPGVWVESMHSAIELVSLLGHLFPSMAIPDYTGGKTDKSPNGLAKRQAWWKGVQDMWGMCQRMKDRQATFVGVAPVVAFHS